ncbi:unnamed protein product, partial [Symbiodinium pilosum]
CAFNMPAKIFTVVGCVVFFIGAIMYGVGWGQAGAIADNRLLVNGQRTFTVTLDH